jgi:hypothetical protein
MMHAWPRTQGSGEKEMMEKPKPICFLKKTENNLIVI